MSLEVNTGRNNNRDATWLQNDNSIEMPLSPSTSESNATSYESTSSEETSVENTDVENQIVNRYVPSLSFLLLDVYIILQPCS